MLPSSSDGTSTGSPSPLVVTAGAGEANPIADAILRGLSAALTCHSAIPKVLEVLVGVSRARWLSPSRGRVALLSLAPFTEREGVDSLPCSVMAGGGRSDIGEAGATRALHSFSCGYGICMHPLLLTLQTVTQTPLTQHVRAKKVTAVGIHVQ